MAKPTTARKPRRWWKIATGLAIVLVVAVATFPHALGKGAARRWRVGRAYRARAPGGIELSSLRLSWFGPTRMTGIVLRARQGGRVLSAPRATWDRSLWRILMDRPR